MDTDTRRGAHGRFAQIKNDTKLDAIVVPGNRPHVPARSHTGRTLQGPVRPGSHPNQACVQGPAASGCGLAERGVTTGLAASIGPSGPPEYAPPVRQRAVRRSRRAGGAPSVRRRSRRVGGAPGRPRPTSDEEIRHAVEGRPGSRAPAKRATSFHGERSRAACVITCQK